MTDLVSQLRQQRSILEHVKTNLEAIDIPYGVNDDKKQRRLDASIANVNLLLHEIGAAIIENMSPEELG